MSRGNTEIDAEKILDSRDIIARFAYLTEERDDLKSRLEDAAELASETADAADAARNNPQDETAAAGLAEEAREALDEAEDALTEWDAEHADELKALADFIDEGTDEFRHGETLIREDHFEDYARELADELGMIPRDAKWPLTCTNWSEAADELRQDYTEADFLGHTYLFRA
jgi:hypothetical protein